MKAILHILIIAISTLATIANALETEYLRGLGDTHYHHVESAIVGRDYHVFVMLPDGYDRAAKKQYPTIYLLDGGALFPILVGYYRYLLLGGEIPEAIIVGISYGTADFEQGNFRGTDYTAPSEERAYYGGAENFQRFLKNELMPLVEETYRSRSDRRIVFGQSIGGQFVIYSAQTDPTLFWGYIASNPALHRNLDYFLEMNVAKQSNSKLFVGNGTLNDQRFRIPAQSWIDHWAAVSEKPWQLKTVELQDHTHMSTPPAAFRRGLHWLFQDN